MDHQDGSADVLCTNSPGATAQPGRVCALESRHGSAQRSGSTIADTAVAAERTVLCHRV